MLQNAFMLEQQGRQVQNERIADANRLRVRALLQEIRKDRKARAR